MPSDSTRGGRGGRGGRGDHIRVGTRSCNQKLDFHPAADTTPLHTPTTTIPHPTLTTTTPLPTPTTSHTTPTIPSGPDGPLHPPEDQAARSTTNKRVRGPTFRTVESTRRPGTPLPTPTNSSITPLPTSTTPVATPAITTHLPTLTTTPPHSHSHYHYLSHYPTTPSGPDGPLHPSEAQAARSATNKRVRGPTFHTVESTRRPGDGPFRAEFLEGRAITQEFITSVGVWIKDIPPTAGNFDDLPIEHREALFQRIAKTGLPVHEGKFFEQTRKRKDGSFSDEKAKKAVEAMVVMEEQHTQEDGSCSIDTTEILAAVVGPDKKGRKRLHGRTEPKSRCGGIPQAMLQSLREEMREVNRQLETRFREAREEARREAREEVRREREAYQYQFPESVQAVLAMLFASLPPQLRVPPSSGSQPGVGSSDRSIGDGGRQ